jgi:two-component sensor histidine kinase
MEEDGPPVTPPERMGFGRRLIERGIPHELGGKVELDYGTTGVRCVMTFPADRILSRGD